MTVARKGLRRIVVEGKTFYWKQDSLAVMDEKRKFLCYADPFEVDAYEATLVGDYMPSCPHNTPFQIASWIKDHLLK